MEANGFLREATTIWCAVAFNNTTQEWIIYANTEEPVVLPKGAKRVCMGDFLDLLSANIPSAHNFFGYDGPLLSKLFGFSFSCDPNLSIDTLIQSRLFYPDRDGHSLKDWGERFKLYKGEHKDFSKFSQELLDYCIQDVRVLTRTRKALEDEMAGWDWYESLRLEYNMQRIQTNQELTGVLFDTTKAKALVVQIKEEIAIIEDKVIPAIPATVVDLGEVKKPFLKNGQYSQQTERWLLNE